MRSSASEDVSGPRIDGLSSTPAAAGRSKSEATSLARGPGRGRGSSGRFCRMGRRRCSR